MSDLGSLTKPKVISATTLRVKTRDVLEEAKFSGEHFIVETFGKPMVAIMGVEEYWSLIGLRGEQDPMEMDA
jgi:hypothetical protein